MRSCWETVGDRTPWVLSHPVTQGTAAPTTAAPTIEDPLFLPQKSSSSCLSSVSPLLRVSGSTRYSARFPSFRRNSRIMGSSRRVIWAAAFRRSGRSAGPRVSSDPRENTVRMPRMSWIRWSATSGVVSCLRLGSRGSNSGTGGGETGWDP